MNVEKVFHNSYDAFYRYPFGAVSAGTAICLRLKIAAVLRPEKVNIIFTYGNRNDERYEMNVLQELSKDIIYERHIKVGSQPQVLWYYFEIQTSEETIYYGNNESCLGGKGSVYQSIPPKYQITVHRNEQGTPEWFKGGIVYQIFVDRFYNGCEDGKVLSPKSNAMLHAHWDDTPVYIKEQKSGKIMRWDFFGGNLLGIIKKLPYLKELGITCLYFNPIFESPSNHKYDTGDYLKIDPMYGDKETFQMLNQKAAELGISIILDGVFSHTGSDSVYFNKQGSYDSVGAYQSMHSPYYCWYRFNHYPDDYECWWGIDTLPNTNEMEPSYLDYMVTNENSVVAYWMNKGVKGWRLDVADELPDKFIKQLRKKVKTVDPESILIGEVWEDASHKTSYGERRQYLFGEELDSVTNYPFRQILLDYLLGNIDADQAQQRLCSLYENYPKESFYSALNVIGTHDVPRILTLLGEAPPEKDLCEEERMNFRLIPVKRELGKKRLKILSLIQMTFPGVPCVYYGDEAGMEGYSDPYNRGPFPWNKEDQELIQWYKRLIHLRKKHIVLQKGEWIPLFIDDDTYGFLRKHGSDLALIVINRNARETAHLSLGLPFRRKDIFYNVLDSAQIFYPDDGKLSLILEPLEGMILFNRPVKKDQLPSERTSGILLHISSLPSPFGIGDLGKDAYRFVDFLEAAHQTFWQVLPITPVDHWGSPYNASSAFAGNPLLISPEQLAAEGLLSKEEVQVHIDLPAEKVLYERVREEKEKWLRRAYHRFSRRKKPDDYSIFLKEHDFWLEDYTLFNALKKRFGGSWCDWGCSLVHRREELLHHYRRILKEEIQYQEFLQYIFYKQWGDLKQYANSRHIKIMGDIPYYVAHDSCDVWVNPQFFWLDENGIPIKVAGVPPDDFNKTGQLWGNPLYRWERMAADDYLWWRKRIEHTLKYFDGIRLDHFRGFESYWAVPYGEKTAALGQWYKGPGERFFEVLQKHIPSLPIIVENLGFITAEVEDLRKRFSFPGIKVLQFLTTAEIHKCDNVQNIVYYTGTHDNDTLYSWYREHVLKHLEHPEQYEERQSICWQLIETVYSSHALMIMIPLQDILALGNEARMNIPGTVEGNWQWRFLPGELHKEHAQRLTVLSKLSHRNDKR